MPRVLVIVLLLLIGANLMALKKSSSASTLWMGKTEQNYPVILEECQLYVVVGCEKRALFIRGEGPCRGIGRWYEFEDEEGRAYVIPKGILINSMEWRKGKKRACCGPLFKKAHPQDDPFFFEPSEIYEGGSRGNALMPSMDDRFPNVAF